MREAYGVKWNALYRFNKRCHIFKADMWYEILQLKEKCRRALIRERWTFSPPTQTAIIRSYWAKCIIYNPQPALLSLRKAVVLKRWRTPTITNSATSSPPRPPHSPPPPQTSLTRLDVAACGPEQRGESWPFAGEQVFRQPHEFGYMRRGGIEGGVIWWRDSPL